MYFQFACTKCGKNLKVREENIGSRVKCPYCHNAMTVEAPDQPSTDEFDIDFSTTSAPQEAAAPASQTGPASSSSLEWSDGSDVNPFRSAFIGIAIAVLTYVVLYPFSDFYVAELFLERGWVPYVLVFLMSWSAAILYLKWQKLTRQRESMLFDLLPNEISDDITGRSAGEFAQHIRGLPVNAQESFLVNRVLRGLEHFRVLRSSPEVSSRLASQSEIDATSVESSYTLLKVFIWAIPILGFIGTVIGISAAVTGFSGSLDQAQDMEVLKNSLNNVVGGLATAFDTTLIALVMSLIVMFPTSSMQKSEEDLLNWVDEYCNENLLRRLKDASHLADRGGSIDHRALQKTIDAAMAEHHAELRIWNEKLDSIGKSLTDGFSKNWSRVDEQSRSRHRETVDEMNKMVQSLIENHQSANKELREIHDRLASFQEDQVRTFDERVNARQQRVDEEMNRLVDRFETTLTGLSEQSETAQKQLASSLEESAQSVGTYFGALKEALESLNNVLEDIGEKKVVIETKPNAQHADQNSQRRGWSLFRK